MITADSLRTADSALITCDGFEHTIRLAHGAAAEIAGLHSSVGGITKHGSSNPITAHGASVSLLRHSAMNSLVRH